MKITITKTDLKIKYKEMEKMGIYDPAIDFMLKFPEIIEKFVSKDLILSTDEYEHSHQKVKEFIDFVQEADEYIDEE